MQNDNVKFKIFRWRTWPYWLRGGIIFFVLATLIFGWVYIGEVVRTYRSNGVISQSGLFLGGYDCHPFLWWNNIPEKFPGEKMYNDSSCRTVIVTSIVATLFFSFFSMIAGSILGWVYGKIRNRRHLIVGNQ